MNWWGLAEGQLKPFTSYIYTTSFEVNEFFVPHPLFPAVNKC